MMESNYSIHDINQRIDASLDHAKSLEKILLIMSLIVFIVGILILGVGFIFEKNIAIGFGALINALIVWPINKLIGIRDQNIRLGIIPALTMTLESEEQQVKVLLKLIDKI